MHGNSPPLTVIILFLYFCIPILFILLYPKQNELQIVELHDDSMDLNEVQHPNPEHHDISLDEIVVPTDEEARIKDENIPVTKVYEEEALPDAIPRDNVIPNDAADQRNEDNDQYSERFLEWQRSLAKQAIISGSAVEDQNTN